MGVDFAVRDGKPWCLEVNSMPLVCLRALDAREPSLKAEREAAVLGPLARMVRPVVAEP